MGDEKNQIIALLLDEADQIRSQYSDRAFKIYEQAYILADTSKSDKEKAYALIGMVMVARDKSDVKLMLEKAFEAIEIYKKIGDDYWYAKTQNLIGIAYFYNGMYEQASEYFLAALKACSIKASSNIKSSIYNNLGEVFRESKKYDIALEYYFSGLLESQKSNLIVNEASLLGNIAEVFLGMDRFNEALDYAERSCEILYDVDHEILLAESENRLGRIYYEMAQYDKAEALYETSFEKLEKTENAFYAIDVLINKALLYSCQDLNRAFLFLNKALRYAERSSAKKKVLNIYEIFADFYEQSGDYRMAYDYFKKYHYLERELKMAVMGDTLEILKLELGRIDVSSNNLEAEEIRMHLEAQIEYQRLEMNKVQEKNKVLEKRVYKDFLTGVNNRSYLDLYTSDLLDIAQNEKASFVLFMIDIDDFKLYNDFWGHLKGDDCLKQVAMVIQRVQQERDHIFGRYGGEEFVYCAKGMTYEAAYELGEVLRQRVEALGIKNDSSQDASPLTITIGAFYCAPDVLCSISQVIGLADEALYHGKRNGRNQVVIRRSI